MKDLCTGRMLSREKFWRNREAKSDLRKEQRLFIRWKHLMGEKGGKNFLNSFLIPTHMTSVHEPPGYDGG